MVASGGGLKERRKGPERDNGIVPWHPSPLFVFTAAFAHSKARKCAEKPYLTKKIMKTKKLIRGQKIKAIFVKNSSSIFAFEKTYGQENEAKKQNKKDNKARKNFFRKLHFFF